jgi:hypothetical protein
MKPARLALKAGEEHIPSVCGFQRRNFAMLAAYQLPNIKLQGGKPVLVE